MPSNHERPSVSVVIPFLSGEFLRQAIQSVLAQTLRDWELVLIDDGCLDNGTTIAQSFASSNRGKVHYSQHENHANLGVCASRNLGVQKSRADYIAFLDADDTWVPHKLEQQLQLLHQYGEVAMLFGTTHYHFESFGTNSRLEDFVERFTLPVNRIYEPPSLLIDCSLGSEPLPSMSSVVVRKDAFFDLGGFDERFVGDNRLYEDQAFLAKFFAHKRVYVAAQCWDTYRRHPHSFTASAETAASSRPARLFYLKWLKEYVESSQVINEQIRGRLRRAMLPYQYPNLYRVAKPFRAVRRWFLNRAATNRRQYLRG